MAYDIKTNTYIPSRVTNISMYTHKRDIVDIYLSSGEIITATKSHPFLTTHGWAAVDPEMSKLDQHYVDPVELHEGDELVNNTNTIVVIKRIVDRDDLQDETVYNCAVEKYNTFIVKGIVVHNAKAQGN